MTDTALIVDDSDSARSGVRAFLASRGFAVREADSCAKALEVAGQDRVDVVVLDYLLPDGNALELLPKLRAIVPGAPVVVLTGHGSIDLAVRALQEGADHFLTKPVDTPVLESLLQRLIERQRERRKALVGSRKARGAADPFIGTSAAIRALADEARRVLQSDSPILLRGETGSGKGVLAAWLHRNGPRRDEAFIDLNCAGLAGELLESELFGHERGAFTGAAAAKPGLFEIADRGAVFLDEIAELPAPTQAKLLKVLEEKRFRRLGAVHDRVVDVRLIAASHADLALLAREKKFRADLYFRISTLPLEIPPLRARREDIPDLARAVLEPIAVDLGKSGVTLSPEAVDALQRHPWPGNVRELRNVLERAVLLADTATLGVRQLRFDVATAESDDACTLEEMERRHIERTLARVGGKVEEAAPILGLPRSTLYARMKKLGLRGGR